MEKQCPKCNTLKNVSEFYRSTKAKDGLYAFCKSCKKEQQRKCKHTRVEKRREQGLQICWGCHGEYPIDTFPHSRWSKDKPGHLCVPCKKEADEIAQQKKRITEKRNRKPRRPKIQEGINLRSLKRRQQIKLDFIKSKGGKCVDCGIEPGEQWPVSVFDFHHLQDKDLSIATILHRKKCYNIVVKELEKCVVLCANCHRKKHFDETKRKLENEPRD